MIEADDLHCESTHRHRNCVAVPVFEGIGFTVAAVADEVSAGGTEFLAANGSAGAPPGRGCPGSCVQRADSVDVRAGVAAIGLSVAVSQADVVESHARRDFSGEIQARGAPFSNADAVPVPEIAADGNFCFFDVRTDLKNVNIIARAIIEGEPQADNDIAAVAEAEVAGGLCRVAGIGQTQGEVRILVVRIAGPGGSMFKTDDFLSEGFHRYRNCVAVPIFESVHAVRDGALFRESRACQCKHHRGEQKKRKQSFFHDHILPFCFFVDAPDYNLRHNQKCQAYVPLLVNDRRVTAVLAKNLIHQSGCWPSCAFHAHSVICISVNTALKLEFSGLQA